MPQRPESVRHPLVTRRTALQAGSIGLLGLGLAEVNALRSLAGERGPRPKKTVIFIFLTGGLSHQDSFDLKPDAPAEVRGEFRPIATRTPGLQVCEHLPLLAQRSERYALVRSACTNDSGHGIACHMLLTGRLDFPAGFNPAKAPNATEWPSMASLVTCLTQGRSDLPPAVVLPQPSINEAGEVRLGQFAGRLGPRWEAWHVQIAAKCALGNGACPHCFRFDGTPFQHGSPSIFETPMLGLPEGGRLRLDDRAALLRHVERQQRALDQTAEGMRLDRHRQEALGVLADARVRAAFDVEQADAKTLERYGKNKFGLSLLMASRLAEAGVGLVQVNLGKNSSWDTHRRNFVNLRDNLLPYLDRAVAALLDDLQDSGRLGETLVVMTGEFGRTPKINKDAGRDHWGPAFTMFFAGGGVRGGNVIGATDRQAAYPIGNRQTPENLAATIYRTLGIPRSATWKDVDGRPYDLYCAEPIPGLIDGWS
jgi:hypothetical protein